MFTATRGKSLLTTTTGALPRPSWYTENLGMRSFLDAMVNNQFREQYVDTVGIYLGMSTKLVKMEKLRIKVTDDGYTRIDEGGKLMNCATEWKDLGAFEDLLVRRDVLARGEG